MSASPVAVLLILCCVIGASRGAECPEDSVQGEDGSCKCMEECGAVGCPPGQRPVQVRPADPETPGSCCLGYNCVSSDGMEYCPDDSMLTKDGDCKCLPCLPSSCRPGHRPVELRPPNPDTPGSCCPLYECRPSESVSWANTPSDETEMPQYCIYNGEAKKVGEQWNKSACESCVCEKDGRHSCRSLMCKSCDNAIPPNPGECCPHCPPLTNVTHVESGGLCTVSLDDCDLECDHGYINDENNCPICQCASAKETEDEINQLTPEDNLCPELGYCDPPCDLVKDKRGCEICVCEPPATTENPTNNSILFDEHGKKICPEVKCGLHCDRGLVMDENDCTFCECKPATDACPPLVGCRKRCAFGYKTNKRGCPICRCHASCTDHLNETYPEGSSWSPNACSTCTCEPGGKLNCKETVCSVGCSNPLPPKPGTCCPVCSFTNPKENEANHQNVRGWETVLIMLVVILGLLCLLLIVHIVRSRFRGRLSPSEASYSSYPPQYYKCVPAYDTPALQATRSFSCKRL